MTEEQIEKVLMEYKEIDKLIETLEKSARRITLRRIALSLGPSDKTTQDITKPRVQASPQDWLYQFGRACEILLKQQEDMCGEYERYISRRAEIWGLVSNAELTNKERQCVLLRYIEGLNWREVANQMNISRPSLNEVRKSALKKIGGEI